MKRVRIATIFIGILLLSGCGKSVDDSFRLKKSIVVDGVNVSSMTVGEAREVLLDASRTRLGGSTLTLRLPRGSTTFTFAALGAEQDVNAALQEAASLRRRGGSRSLESPLTVDKAALNAVLSAYVSANETTPSDALISIEPAAKQPVSYVEEREGVDIHEEALVAAVEEALTNGKSCVLDVPCTRLSPAVTTASLMAQKALIAQYSTSFERAPYDADNRVFNIEKAADAINGLLLQPGETFDCNAVLGDRTAGNGWQEANAIRNGRYETEFGGGVCQVSSTLFNAVLMADLTILERHPHSWPMGYVEIGRDATISTGGKNFRFVNSGTQEIQLFVHVDRELKTVTVSLYGAPLPEGQYIDVVSEKTGTLESAGETLMLDETLPYNTRSILREARDGKTSVTYKEYHSSDGTLLRREEAYRDTYRAIDGLTYVSTDLYYGQTMPENTQPTNDEASE